MNTETAERTSDLADRIDSAAQSLEAQVIAWRRDIHANPELGNREMRTAKIVAEHLKRLGLRRGAHRRRAHRRGRPAEGRLPGPVVALRADMDALPVTEEVDVPFASKVRTIWNGEEVGVMHACGHDCHIAILMGVAEVLAGLRDAAARHGQVHLPAGRGDAARRRGRRRAR